MQEFFYKYNISAMAEKFMTFLPNIVDAMIVVVFIYAGFRLGAYVLRLILLRNKIEETLIGFLAQMLKVIFIIVGVILIAEQLRINVAATVTGIGVVGVALGFAAQETLANVIAGFVIFIDKPFKVGDYITYGSNYGKVQHITMRSTRIRTLDNTFVVVPNHKIINEVVVDHSTKGEVRLVIPASIAYKESIDRAREVLISKISKIEGVLEKPAPDVVVDNLADSGVTLFVRAWIHNAKHENAMRYKLVEETKKALDEAGIEIPFPHRKIITA